MGAEDFTYLLQAKPGAYFLIGNGDGSAPRMGHGGGPCMLHNPSYDFNDDLIPLGATYWVRLAEEWLAQRALQDAALHARGISRSSYAEARDKFLRRGRRRRPGRRVASRTRCSGATARSWRWTWRATARPMPTALLIVSSACHGVEGYLRLAACRSRCSTMPRGATHAQRAGVAVLYIHALNPYGFSWLRGASRTKTST